MITKPIIPLAIMIVLCILLLVCKRKGWFAFIRQIIIVTLIFFINLNIMVPNGTTTVEKKSLNLNVIFVVDNTISMVANDYGNEKTRLEGVSEGITEIVNKLAGARFCVLSFNTSAQTKVPFTTDDSGVIDVVDGIYPLSSLYSKGSSMNVSKPLLLETLQRSKKTKGAKTYVFYITDGEITNQEPLDSFKDLAEYIDGGAVLGYGTEQGGTMKLYNQYSEEYEDIMDYSEYPEKPAVSVLDEKNLKQLASDMGIEYVHMTKATDIDPVVDKIKAIPAEAETTQTEIRNYKPTYQYFAVPLVLMLFFEMFLFRRRA